MILLLLGVAAWLAIVSFVAGLCLAARRGEMQPEPDDCTPAWEEAPESIAA
jgi:hypothetical protein